MGSHLYNNMWLRAFPSKEDRHELLTKNATQMPDIDPELKRYLDSYVDKVLFLLQW